MNINGKREAIEESKELDFIQAENRALQQEKQRLHAITVQALEEFRTLLKPQYCHQLEQNLKNFFIMIIIQKYLEMMSL